MLVPRITAWGVYLDLVFIWGLSFNREDRVPTVTQWYHGYDTISLVFVDCSAFHIINAAVITSLYLEYDRMASEYYLYNILNIRDTDTRRTRATYMHAMEIKQEHY